MLQLSEARIFSNKIYQFNIRKPKYLGIYYLFRPKPLEID
jgi:hypothetical protein